MNVGIPSECVFFFLRTEAELSSKFIGTLMGARFSLRYAWPAAYGARLKTNKMFFQEIIDFMSHPTLFMQFLQDHFMCLKCMNRCKIN